MSENEKNENDTIIFESDFPTDFPKLRESAFFNVPQNGILAQELTSSSLLCNDQLKITYTMKFEEPKPLSKMEKVIKVFRDKINYLAGYRLNLININDTCEWD